MQSLTKCACTANKVMMLSRAIEADLHKNRVKRLDFVCNIGIDQSAVCENTQTKASAFDFLRQGEEFRMKQGFTAS